MATKTNTAGWYAVRYRGLIRAAKLYGSGKAHVWLHHERGAHWRILPRLPRGARRIECPDYAHPDEATARAHGHVTRYVGEITGATIHD